jgi:SAM-dependent methyltransferase
MMEEFNEAFWDERYSTHTALWSGHPNANLIAEVSELVPGRALDIGCGEGADVHWLAEQGWLVTGLDVSGVALDRAAAQAAKLAPGVSARIDWVHADVAEWVPPAVSYDLVSAQYVHLPRGMRDTLLARLLASVAPGGTLLFVGHHPSDLAAAPRPFDPELFFTGEDLVGALSPSWEVVTNTTAVRESIHEGHDVTLHDTVFRARRQR